MSLLVISYRVRPEAAAENRVMVETVFGELAEVAPDGLRYATLQLADDRFVHIADVAPGANALPGLASFQRFSSTVGDRCAPGDGPNPQPAELVGNYGLLLG